MNIKALREAAGLSQSQLVRAVNERISKPLLSNIENGHAEAPAWLVSYLIDATTLRTHETQNSPVITRQIAEQTRLESYHLMDKSNRRAMILCALTRPMTSRELTYRLGFQEPNAVRPRLTELEKMGKVRVIGKRKDPITERNVSVYVRTFDMVDFARNLVMGDD